MFVAEVVKTFGNSAEFETLDEFPCLLIDEALASADESPQWMNRRQAALRQ